VTALRMVWCCPEGQALVALPRCLRAAQAQPECQFLPGHSPGAGDRQQGGFELVNLCADPGHQRQRSGQVGSVHGILAVLHRWRARRQAHQQPDRLVGADHGRMTAAIAAGRVIRVPLLDAGERGVFPFGSRPRCIRRGPGVGHACEYRAGTYGCQLIVFNTVFTC
jgi:hypothetical protein